MGHLVNGEWHDQWYETESTGGRFVRNEAQFRNWVTADGSAGPSGTGGFQAEPDRYHLYIGHACPWAHRTHIFRNLKGLEAMISLSVVAWFMGDKGWTYEPAAGVIPDPINDARYHYEIYCAADPNYSGRVTIPVLWDTQKATIVSNESSEIIRMFNSAFDRVGARDGDYYPGSLRSEIDAVNERVYHTLNNGVYRCGFATTQEAYEEAVYPLFETLDWLEERLDGHDYLVGDTLTEADWRVFTTLVRFDPVYVGHFKCNIRRLRDYPRLWAHTKRLYAVPGVAATVHMDHIKNHYYGSHETINPSRIVPVGPAIEYA
jgi:putative glutathione S-transferase